MTAFCGFSTVSHAENSRKAVVETGGRDWYQAEGGVTPRFVPDGVAQPP